MPSSESAVKVITPVPPSAPRARPEQSLLDDVRAALAEHLAREENLRLHSLEISARHPRPFSEVAFLVAHTDRDVRRLVMKTLAHHPENQSVAERANQAVVQYEILSHLYPRFASIRNCSVPKPVLVLPPRDTLLTEFVEGSVLSDELRRARYFSSEIRFAELREWYLHCGRWLKHFQAFTGTRNSGLEALDEMLSRTDHRLTLIENAGDGRCPREVPNQVRRLLLDHRAELAGQPIPVSGCHGDFGPWNVLGTPSGVTVLDFFGYQDGPVAEDPLGILFALEQERKCLTANPRRLELLRQSLLDGLSPLPCLPKPLLVICETLHRVRGLWSALSRTSGKLHHRLESRRRLRANLEWLSDDRRRQLLWPADCQA
jgi:Phosphotransferase enzyme family